MEHQNNKGFISSLKPKAAFRLGIVYSVIVVFIIAFFILLGMFIKKDNNSLTGNTDNNKNNVKQEIIKGDSGIGLGEIKKPQLVLWNFLILTVLFVKDFTIL